MHKLSSDNGKEFSLQQEIAAQLGASIYFARPYHAWEEGVLNEHTNGLVRQYLPKNQCLDEIENLLNNPPLTILLEKC